MKKKQIYKLITSILLNLFFIIICFFVMIPILYAFSVSLNAQNSMLSTEFSFLPKQLTLQNYISVFNDEPVLLWLLNSSVLAVTTIIVSLAVSIPAAYIFSRKEFKGRKTILNILLLLYSFPSILSMFAIYKLLSPLGLINTRSGLILIYTGTMAIFGLWNMKGYFDTIPLEIEEAAQIDGASSIQLVLKILLPLAKIGRAHV